MANTLLTPSVITKEALIILENNLVAAKKVRRDFENRFGAAGSASNIGGKLGDTLNVRLPNKFRVRTSMTLLNDDVTEKSTALVVDKVAGADFTFSTTELTLKIDDFAERYLHPAMATIANKIDFDVLQLYKSVWNQVGTPRTTPSTYNALGAVTKRMNEGAVPRDGNRYLCYDPAAELAFADAFKALFNPSSQVSTGFEEMQYRQIAGLKLDMDQNVALHTCGTQASASPLVNDVYVAGDTSISIDAGTASGTVVAGDTFTIAGVFAVNPQSRQSTGVLQQIVVTALNTASGGGAYTDIAIDPPLFASGPLQNVTALPADNAAVTFADTNAQVSTQNLAFHKDAFALATVPLELPQGVHFAARESYKGINMRIVRQYQISTDIIPCRIDVIYGTKAIYPALACRLAG